MLALSDKLEPSAALQGVDFYIPEPQATTAWPLPGGTPAQAWEHVAAAPAFKIAWRRDIGEGTGRKTNVTAPPVGLDGRIFTMDGEARVVASDTTNGARVWEADLSPDKGRDREAFGGGLAVAEGKLIVSSGFRFVAALDPATGKVLWKTATESPIHAAPTIAGNRAFVVDVDNEVMALDLNTGEIQWSFQAIVEPARILRASSPAVEGDAIVTPFSSGELVALRASNGNPLWSETLSRTSRTSALSEIRDIAGRPVVSRGVVYAVSHSGLMSAIDVRTGQPKWQLPVSGVNAPLPVGDVVYVVSKAGELTVINRETGQIYWTRDLNEGRIRQEGGFFGFFDRTVRPVWSGPLLASNRLVLTNSDGELVAFDPKTGLQTATVRVGPAFIAPAAYNGALYVLTDQGQLVSIR